MRRIAALLLLAAGPVLVLGVLFVLPVTGMVAEGFVVDGRFAGVDTGEASSADLAGAPVAAAPGKGGDPVGPGAPPGDLGNERGGGPWMGLAPVERGTSGAPARREEDNCSKGGEHAQKRGTSGGVD